MADEAEPMNSRFPVDHSPPIPVGAAQLMAESFHKHAIVIVAYDLDRDRTQITTWGQRPEEKAFAARVSDDLVNAWGRSDVVTHEDFRAITAAAYRENLDRIIKLIREAMTHLDTVGLDEIDGVGAAQEPLEQAIAIAEIRRPTEEQSS